MKIKNQGLQKKCPASLFFRSQPVFFLPRCTSSPSLWVFMKEEGFLALLPSFKRWRSVCCQRKKKHPLNRVFKNWHQGRLVLCNSQSGEMIFVASFQLCGSFVPPCPSPSLPPSTVVYMSSSLCSQRCIGSMSVGLSRTDSRPWGNEISGPAEKFAEEKNIVPSDVRKHGIVSQHVSKFDVRVEFPAWSSAWRMEASRTNASTAAKTSRIVSIGHFGHFAGCLEGVAVSVITNVNVDTTSTPNDVYGEMDCIMHTLATLVQ